MASGNRSEFGNWGLDKSELNLDYCDVGLGLKIPWQHQQQQQQQEAPQGSSLQQQRQQHCNITGAVPWLHNRQILADNNRVTFTAGQRQELERQTIIYKYMMSSLPVPPELLIPFSKYPSSNSPITTTSSPSGVEMRYTMSRGGDPEPWRCRRTDGKKWRCSRDVAPDQKYCERHSHKGRPSRSRKPVEPPSSLLTSNSHNNNNNNNNNNNVNVTLPSITSNPTTFFSPYTISKPSSSPSSFELPCIPQLTSLPRYPDWFMKKDIAPTPTIMYSPQHQLVTGETTSSHQLNDEHHQNCLLSRPFIDAWSLADPKNVIDNENNDNNTLATNKCPPPASSLNSILPLTLSMSAGVDLENHDTGDNIKDHLEIRSSSPSNNQPLYWMNSWVSSPPGGPLAEALCLGMSGTGNGLMMSHSEDHLVSPHGCSTSSTTTTLG